MIDGHLDVCFGPLSDRHRRRVIQRLRYEIDGRTTVDDLVDQLHSSEADSVRGPLTDRNQIALRLIHIHLPKLADCGVIEYDPKRETVQYRPDERIETVLDSFPKDVPQTNR